MGHDDDFKKNCWSTDCTIGPQLSLTSSQRDVIPKHKNCLSVGLESSFLEVLINVAWRLTLQLKLQKPKLKKSSHEKK